MATATTSAAIDFEVKRPDTFRQSFLARYDKCPRSAAFYLRFDGGLETHPKTRGTAFHEFMQRATETMMEQGEPMMPGDVGRELADAIMAEHPEWVLTTADQDVVRLCAWNWCEATVLDLEAIIGVELDLEIEIGGVTVTCRIDRAEVFGSSLHLHDAKTSLHVPSREEVALAFQPQMYALASLDGVRPDSGLGIGAGINDVWWWQEYPRYRAEEGPLVTKEASWLRSELHEFRVSLERNVAALERSFETGEWPARSGSWCNECAAAKLCPIPTELQEFENVETPEQAQDAFSRKLANEREGRRIQSALRGFVQREEQPIYQGDLAFDAKFSESKSIKDWDQLLLALLRTTETGVAFEINDHVELRQSTKFAKRKQTPEEMEERENDAAHS